MIFKCVCCDKVQELIKEWVSKAGHDKCWYYPELLEKIAEVYSIDTKQLPDIPEEEFKEGCDTFRKRLYNTLVNLGDKAIRNQDFDMAIKLRDIRENMFVGQTPEEKYTQFIKDFVTNNKEFLENIKTVLNAKRKVNWFSEVTKAKQEYNESKFADTDYHDSLLEDFQNNK